MKDLKTIFFLFLAIILVGAVYRYLETGREIQPPGGLGLPEPKDEIEEIFWKLEEETKAGFCNLEEALLAWPGLEKPLSGKVVLAEIKEDGGFEKIEAFFVSSGFETKFIQITQTGYQREGIVCLVKKLQKTDSFSRKTRVKCAFLEKEEG